MAAPASTGPRPSTAPPLKGFGTVIDTPIGGGTQQTGQILSQDYNPAPAPQEFRIFGLTLTQLVVVAAVGFGIYYFRKEIWNFVGKKIGAN